MGLIELLIDFFDAGLMWLAFYPMASLPKVRRRGDARQKADAWGTSLALSRLS